MYLKTAPGTNDLTLAALGAFGLNAKGLSSSLGITLGSTSTPVRYFTPIRPWFKSIFRKLIRYNSMKNTFNLYGLLMSATVHLAENKT